MIAPGGMFVRLGGRMMQPWEASFAALFPCALNELQSRPVLGQEFPGIGVSAMVLVPVFGLL